MARGADIEPDQAGAGLDRAVIISGTGRCGSTLLHRLLARHGDLGWISTVNEVLPRMPALAALSRLYGAPLPARLREARAFPKPFEAYRFWESYLPGFSRRESPQRPEEITQQGAARARRAVQTLLRAQGRPRLLIKVTGWARMEYFDRLFPAATFVILDRDPRSVISSWVKAGWLDVTSTPGSPEWEWGPVPEPYLELWRELGASPILSAAIKVKLDLDDIERNTARLPGRCHRLQYERLISAPEASLSDVLEACGLAWDESLREAVATTRFVDTREKWRDHLGDDDARAIVQFFERAGRAAPAA